MEPPGHKVTLIRKIHLAFPLAVFALVACELLLRFGTSRLYYSFLADFLFLNSTHVLFTLVMLHYHPSFRRWSRQHYSHPGALYFRLLGVGALGAGLIYFASGIPGAVTLGCAVIYLIWSSYHAIMQVYGLLNQYGVDSGQYRAEAARMEKRLVQGIFLLYVIARTASFPLGLSATAFRLILWSQLAVSLLLFGTLLARTRREQGGQKGEKTLFLLRLLLYPLASFSMVARFAVPANHGLEHVFVTEKMLLNTPDAAARRKILTALGLALFAGTVLGSTALLYTSRYFISPHNWGRWIFSSMAAFAGMHFYLEGEMFRMKNPASRRELAPLLKAASSPGASAAFPRAQPAQRAELS